MWTVRLLPRAENALTKIDRDTGRRIRTALDRIASRDDPATACKALSGPLTGLWRYRVGNWRIILDIDHGELVIVAVDIGHRSTIYD